MRRYRALHCRELKIQNLYNKTRHSYIYIMLPIAGQTGGPIGLNFFVDTHGWSTCAVDFKKKIQFFIPRSTPGPSASN